MNNITFKTSAGTILGWQDGEVIRASGIPYAVAGRYQKPVELTALGSKAPYIATKHSPACPQSFSPVLKEVLGMDMLDELKMDENCQYLSITMPLNESTTPKPVMVWIHGGSYLTGGGDMAAYDPTLLVHEQQVIVVNITYRLGLFGFLGGYRDVPPNLGLMDIIVALRWIKKHIAAFGGDPGNITLFGQSAGGDAIAHLMLAEGVSDLFHRVIIQSAPLGIREGKSSLTSEMIKRVETSPKDISTESLLTLQDTLLFSMKRFGLKGGMPFGVQYGYAPLPEEKHVEDVWRQRAGQWDVFIGWASRETALFAPFLKPLQALAAVPLLGKPTLEWLIRETTDRVYRNAGKAFARMMATGSKNVYEYQIDWGAVDNPFRAAHVIDIPLLFGNVQLWRGAVLCKGKSADELAAAGQKLRTLWAAFARTGTLEEKKDVPDLISLRRINGVTGIKGRKE